MVTEQERLQFLSLLSRTMTDMDEIIEKLKGHGICTTPEQINAAINQLKMVRGD